MSESEHEIATRLGTGFAKLTAQFLAAVTEGLARNPTKEISFGATVKAKIEAGVIVCRLIPHEPKIPTEPMEPMHFILKQDDSGQLSFLFAGSLKEMSSEVEKRAAQPEDPDDDYTASHKPSG